MTGLVATIGPPWYLVAPYKQAGGGEAGVCGGGGAGGHHRSALVLGGTLQAGGGGGPADCHAVCAQGSRWGR